MQVRDIGLLLGRFIGSFEHGGLDATGEDSVDPDVLRPVFRGQDLGQTDQPGFARRIGCRTGKSDSVADKGACEDDRTFALLQHGRDLVLGGEERARQIDLERLVPGAERNARSRSLLTECAGVIESDIEAAVALLCSALLCSALLCSALLARPALWRTPPRLRRPLLRWRQL